MRTRLTMTVAALLLIAMLLIWQRGCETENARFKTGSEILSFAEFCLDGQEGQLILMLEEDMQATDISPPLLAAAMTESSIIKA